MLNRPTRPRNDVHPKGNHIRRSARPIVTAALSLILGVLPYGVPASAAATTNPVVLVHGLNSSPKRWAAYLGTSGYLEKIGRRGFAVGDGQAPGVLRIGSELEPFAKTNTIAENAEILRAYIRGVKRLTGATQVDIVAHSMGGLISRYYIDRLMDEGDVGRLIMLGTPNGGSPCANLAARLRISVPATVELRPSYVQNVFNQQVDSRNGVPFFALAGDPLSETLRSPCAGTPSDLVVSVDSVQAIGVEAVRLPVLHNSLNDSVDVFEQFVAPSLAAVEQAPAVEPRTGEDLQTVALSAGRVQHGESVEQVLNLDEVSVATFTILDPTRSLAVSVRGANGAVIQLTSQEHGLIRIDDPQALFYLGYGFDNPQPGPWRVTLHATSRTPAAGADFAVSAQVQGGTDLTAQSSELLPELGEKVLLSTSFDDEDQPIAIRSATAQVHSPDGRDETVTLTGDTTRAAGDWRPSTAGLHSIDVSVLGETITGTTVERTAFLAAEVQPAPTPANVWAPVAVIAAIVPIVLGGITLAVLASAWLLVRRRRSQANR